MEHIRGRGDSRTLRTSRNARSTDGSAIPRIFLSYARGDDEPYARSVYEQLFAEGFDVWFDREDMPSRALTFLQEIRDAVRSRDRLLVVLGPTAALSDYVRAKWQAALVDGKVVTPVLRLGDYDLVPPELKNLHCPDVRPGRPPEEAFGELLRILRDPVPPVGPLRGRVPELPAHFQPRPDDLSALADTLLYDIEHPAASSASASRSMRTICCGVCLFFLSNPPCVPLGASDSHSSWISFRGAGQGLALAYPG
jgi:hypothetical protein